jgi:DNA topoisomerase-1
MPKKYSTTTSLLIVESPAKCKKIEEYLGPGYKCIASYGHLRELTGIKNIDIDNNFTPTYSIIDNAIKRKQLENIKKEIKKADEVILACDADREGEKICYCIAEIFNLDINKTKRITFTEITENALKEAIKSPRTINMDIVNAQQARQILDVLVGFKVSPMLWKFISTPKGKNNALSAGRCQSPALKIIYENDQEIKKANDKKVYNTTGYFTSSNIPFELNKQFESEDEMQDFLEGSSDFSHIYTCSQPSKIYKKPPEPFTTSTLQQTASNELHYSPKETMRICQNLYEGGYITYMRTDSKTYSGDFIENVKSYIRRTYAEGDKYINENIDSLTTGVIQETGSIKKTKKSDKPEPQEAHEAIRPTDISLFELPETMESKEIKMYKLIRENTLESCMASASFYSITATIFAYNSRKFTYSTELIDFAGWKIVTKKYSSENKEYYYLQTIKQNDIIPYKKICSHVTIKGLKHHYTEARLVHLLEEKGIGRPSTFASLVDKIQERGYVKKEDVKGTLIDCNDYELEDGEIFVIDTKREIGNEKSKLLIQPLGIIVIDFLNKFFGDLFNYEYTKRMEDELDNISKGNTVWYELCRQCNNQVDELIDNLKDETKIEFKIDDSNTFMIGKYGPVIKCSEDVDGKEEIKFKSIKKDVDLKKLEKGEYNVDEIVDTNKTANTHYVMGQYKGNDVVLKKGKYGLYITCGGNTRTIKELGNRPIENIRLEDIIKYLDEGSNIVREISKDMTIRRGPKGDYLFYKTVKMKKPKFYDIKAFNNEENKDYKKCDIVILKSWINEKYQI